MQLESFDSLRHLLWDGDQPYNLTEPWIWLCIGSSEDVKIDFTSTHDSK
jgi:hypothetical protein